MSIRDIDIKLSDTLWKDHRLDDGARWQVIYITTEGKDYARETYKSDYTLQDICMIANKEIKNRSYLSKAKIERW